MSKFGYSSYRPIPFRIDANRLPSKYSCIKSVVSSIGLFIFSPPCLGTTSCGDMNKLVMEALVGYDPTRNSLLYTTINALCDLRQCCCNNTSGSTSSSERPHVVTKSAIPLMVEEIISPNISFNRCLRFSMSCLCRQSLQRRQS